MPLAATVRAGGTGVPSTGSSRSVAPWSITSPRSRAGESSTTPRTREASGDSSRKLVTTAPPMLKPARTTPPAPRSSA
ncbi:MAG: hypothetical protein K0S88_5644 [Actinomycetia bacterium]|nr:hypothetical protein [Actinomycetes bacterium]